MLDKVEQMVKWIFVRFGKVGIERFVYTSLGLFVFGLLGVGLMRANTPLTDEGQRATFFQIGTGSTSGTYFSIGEMLAAMISRPPGSEPCVAGGHCGVAGIVAIAKSSAGSVANVRSLGAKRFDSALIQADVLDAAASGVGIFKRDGKATELRVIANLFPDAVHLVVSVESGIETIGDLKGKRISIGSPGSGTRANALAILKAIKLTRRKALIVEENASRSAELLLAGEVDAFFLTTGAPARIIEDLAIRKIAHVISIEGEAIDRLRIEQNFFDAVTIEAGTYPGSGEVHTLAVGALWVTRADQPDELIYQITRALFAPYNHSMLTSGHPKGRFINAATAVRGVPILLHPGAERYYFQAGILEE
ncbi:MAG: TAXI family TRAP transporter solute-binding subunit [Parvibaculaceae bacterium]|nr:TAXI family TRAP transporter solute-binding subunit [Parvibaculaceae bacterium]